MSNFETFGVLSSGIPGTAPAVFLASTVDNLAAVMAVGYLNDLGDKVKLNDRFVVNYSDTSVQPVGGGNANAASVTGNFLVVVSGANVSLVQELSSLALLNASVPVSAAEFNGMYAAPKLLLAAPGANKMLVVSRMELVMTFGSADYAAGGVVAAQYDSTAHGAGVLATNSEAAADFFAAASTVFNFNGSVVLAPFSTCANKGLYLSNATQAFTTGDSPMVANVLYRVLSLV